LVQILCDCDGKLYVQFYVIVTENCTNNFMWLAGFASKNNYLELTLPEYLF
jgi:hypothetical protein